MDYFAHIAYNLTHITKKVLYRGELYAKRVKNRSREALSAWSCQR